MTATPVREGAAVPVAAAAALLADAFGLAGRLQPLGGERDQNLRLDAGAAGRFTVKIAPPDEEPALADLQALGLEHVAATDPGLPVPRLVRSRRGAVSEEIRLSDGGVRRLRVLSFLEGEILDGAPPSPAQHRALGAAHGRLAAALSGFEHPAADHHHEWDLVNAPEVRPRLAEVAAERRPALGRILDRFEAGVLPRLVEQPRQVVHNDLNPHNVLVDPADPARIAGIIDFGDMVRTGRIADVAVAASYLMRHEDGVDAIVAFTGGYAARAPLGPDEVALLPDLLAVRLAMSVIVAEWRSARQPWNRAYLMRNHAGALAGLARLAAAEPAALGRRLREVVDRAQPRPT